jgi:Reverse transcriptase (RNA-dependent DNA polymerase)
MRNIKLQIVQQWKVKDLGKPAKIIGIEIKHTCDTVSISQKKYIETILKKEGMERANPVATPLHANVTIEPNPDHFKESATTTYV